MWTLRPQCQANAMNTEPNDSQPKWKTRLVEGGFPDRTFDIELKSPPASVLLKEAVKAEKGSGEPNKNKIGTVTMAQCKAIAKEKVKDLNAFDEDHAARIIAGTARSMGITVEG